MSYPKRRHATPSEPVTWKRIGMPPRCTKCGKKMILTDVRNFGTTYAHGVGERFVVCKDCWDAP